MDELSSDDSIIENTPPTKKIKCISKKEEAKNLEDDRSHLLQELVDEFERNISQEAGTSSKLTSKESDTETGCSSLTTNVQDDANKSITRKHRGITEPLQKPFSKNSHRLHVFYQIHEVLEFSPNNFPKNTNVHLVGVVSYSFKATSFILSNIKLRNSKSAQIKLDLRQMPENTYFEDENYEISVFGELTFQEQTPIIFLSFFKKFTVNFSTYLKLMLELRTTIPLENFERIHYNYDALNDDSSDESMKESEVFLNSLEVHSQNSESHQLSDAKLHAFLDDISFEKL